MNPRDIVKYFSKLPVFLHTISQDIHNHASAVFPQKRQLFIDKFFYADIFQAYGIEHSAWRFNDSGRRISGPGLKRYSLHNHGPQPDRVHQRG